MSATDLPGGDAAEGRTTGESRPADSIRDAQIVAQFIDTRLEQEWKAAGITPAPESEDGEFLRRVFLHLNGTLPDVLTVRRFLDDDSPHKRQQQIDRCLDGAAYCGNFARVFREILLPSSSGELSTYSMGSGFEIWFARELARETPYDQIVREIVAGESGRNDPSRRPDPRQIDPSAFYRTRQGVAESMAAATTRHFLGIRIECAQCHDHPFDHWTQQEFWSVAAFFSGAPTTLENGQVTYRIKVPDTEDYATAAFLDDPQRGWDVTENSRQLVSTWVTAGSNRRFSRMAVNRIWGHLFGRGLVEPVDDFSDRNPASHPQVLDLLADEFVNHDYDLKFLIRAITYSKAYQLSSRRTDPSQDTEDAFARMRVQGLTASQLSNAIAQATGSVPAAEQRYYIEGNIVEIPDQSLERLFPASDGSSLERESSILQALLLMNGPLTALAIHPHGAGTLGATLNAPFLDTDQKIDTLFLATLSRYPSPSERERAHAYLKSAADGDAPSPFAKLRASLIIGKVSDPSPPLADLFWVLLNSSEFGLNH